MWHLPRLWVAASALLIVCAQAQDATAAVDTEKLQPVKILFLTDCSKYSNWQGIGDAYSFKLLGQPGSATRVMCCTEEERKKFDPNLLKEMDTWIAPSYTIHPRTGDGYLAYNKPEAVIDYLDNNTPKEEYVLVLDSDMLVRRPFLVEDMHPKPGWARGAKYTYMIGVNNDLAERHIPEIAKRNDTYAGPLGRRADQVGGFFFAHRDDMKRMSHGWLKYTEDVRADPEAWHLTGDVYAVKPGLKPWISEMYGYAYGAATANLWHKWDGISMLYPGYDTYSIPKLMHYGLIFDVDDGAYKYDKHWFYDFDITKCPPWKLGPKAKEGVFTMPPRASQLKSKSDKTHYFRDLLSLETMGMLNAGFCDYHIRHCPPSQQLLDVCTEILDHFMETQSEINRTEPALKCSDKHFKCKEWAGRGECVKNFGYMQDTCSKSCNECNPISESWPRHRPTDTLALLEDLRQKLHPAAKANTDNTVELAAKDPDSTQVNPGLGVQSMNTIKPQEVKVEKKADPSPPPPSVSPPPAKVVSADAEEEVHVTKQHHLEGHRKEGTHLRGGSEAADEDEEDGDSDVVSSTAKERKALLLRCYRLKLTPKEIRACASAAARGVTWQSASTINFERDGDHEAHDLTTMARRRKLIKSELNSDDKDIEDLRNLEEEVNAPAHKGISGSGILATLSGLSTGQAVLLWAVVLIGVLYVAPKALKATMRRNRHKSGMRSE